MKFYNKINQKTEYFMRKIFVLLNIICAGLLFTCISYAENSNESHEDKVKHSIYDISVIEKQLEAYKKEHGHYPKTEEGLENLKKYNVTVVPDHIVPNRYLEGNFDSRNLKWEGYNFPAPDLVDGWGRNYEYKSNGVKYSIHSYGEKVVAGDNNSGTDIVIFSNK